MSFAIKTTVTGAPELFKALRAINKKIARQTMKKAVAESARVVLRTAKSLVPIDTGMLKKSLAVKVKTFGGGDGVVGIVGPRTGKATTGKGAARKKTLTALGKKFTDAGRWPAYYAHLVEFGTRGQRGREATIPAVVSKKGKRDSKGRFLKSTRKSRSRKGPQPFLRPALDSNTGAIRAIIRMRLEQALRNAGVS